MIFVLTFTVFVVLSVKDVCGSKHSRMSKEELHMSEYRRQLAVYGEEEAKTFLLSRKRRYSVSGLVHECNEGCDGEEVEESVGRGYEGKCEFLEWYHYGRSGDCYRSGPHQEKPGFKMVRTRVECGDGSGGISAECRDIDECSEGTHNCYKGDGGKCTNTRGAFSCSCSSGWHGDGLSSCTPVCQSFQPGSAKCKNGGTCNSPDSCSCVIEYYPPACDPCPVADIANCRHMSCDAGPSNEKCFECKWQYQSLKNKAAYTPNADKTFCDPLCSWKENFCFPGSCSSGYPDTCSCSKDFENVGSAKCDLTKQPELHLCKASVVSSSGERRQSQPTVAGSTSCYTEGPEWIKFKPASFKLDLEATFQHSSYTKLPYVRDYKYGITKSSVKLYKVPPAGPNVDIITYTMPGDGVCTPSGPYGDGTGQPKDQITCDIDKTLSYTSFADGDKLCADFIVVAGGYTHYGDPNTNMFEQTQKNRDVPRSKEVCMRMDFTPPDHCSRASGAKKCSTPTEYMTFGDRIRKTGTINLDFRGWLDLGTNPSGVKEFIINVYDITESSPTTVGMVFSPVRVGPVTLQASKTTHQLTLPVEPQFYAIDLTVVDNALNVRQARSYVLYDASSKLLIDNSKKMYFSTATQVTNYLWQTDLNTITLQWNDHFYNDYHRQHSPLRPVDAETSYFEDNYDQMTGDLPRKGTTNAHGVTVFKYYTEELTPIGTNSTNTSEPNSWSDFSTWSEEKIDLSAIVSEDGDTHKVWIQGTDIMGNKIVDKRVIHIDSSPPEIWDTWLTKDGHEQLYVHDSHELQTMQLVFKIRDIHSGIRKVYYRLGVSSGGSTEHGDGAVPVVHLGNQEKCPVPGDPCYCPKIGPCEMLFYRLDLNPIVASNKHLGLHNRDYYFEIEATNEARLVTKKEIKVLVDNSPPINGTVWDGNLDEIDVDFRSDNTVVGSWGGFVDYESGIKYYKYAVADRCWTSVELYANGTKTTANTTGSLTTNLNHYFVSVIAINNAVTPSVASCSDGVIIDKTPPNFVKFNVPDGIYKSSHPPFFHHKDTLELSWEFNETESQIRDYEVGFASAENKKSNPDIVGFTSTQMTAHFKKQRAGFGQGSYIFAVIKAINKVGLETIKSIGPFIIDQTPPLTEQTFAAIIDKHQITLSWSVSDFKDNEDTNPLASFKWALGTSEDTQELVKFTHINESTPGKYHASFPVQTAISHDNERDKEYFFFIEVTNSALLSSIVKSKGFRLPTTSPPPRGVVYDIKNASSMNDIDYRFSSSELCAKWARFEHYRDNVTYQVAIGSTTTIDDIKSFTDVSSVTLHCFTGLTLVEKSTYYFIVRALGSAGNTTASSDGVKIINPSSQSYQLQVFDGKGCDDAQTCTNDISFQSSRLHLAAWWRASDDASSTHYLVSVSQDNCTRAPNSIVCSEFGSITSKINVGKVNKYIMTDLTLEGGKKYHFKVAMCFQSACLPEVISSGVIIYNAGVTASSVSAAVSNVSKVSDTLKLVIEAEWIPFTITEGTLQSKSTQHQWALTSEPEGKAPITTWTNISSTLQSSKLQVRHEIDLQHRPLKQIYFSVKGYNPLGAFSIASTPLIFEIGDTKIDEGHYVFDMKTTENVRDLINSVVLDKKMRILHDLDLDYVSETSSISAVVTGIQYPEYFWYVTDTPGALHHYITYSYNLTGHAVNATNATMPMPFGCSRGMKECIGEQIKSVNSYVTFTGLKLQHGIKYYTCVHCDKATVVREKSKEELPELRLCSNGYIVDTSPPSVGKVTLDTLKDGYTHNNNELIIRWSGFADIEELTGSGMFHSNGIKTYKYGIGLTPGGTSVRSFVDVGQSLSTIATGLNLESGKTYFVVVRAFDHVGKWAQAVSAGVLVDTTPPRPSFVRVGSPASHFKTVHCDSFGVHWGDFDDPHTASLRYKIAVGTHQHSQDILPFTDTSHNFVVLENLDLVQGHHYYVQISATNVVGLFAIASSASFTCDKTAPEKGFVYDGLNRNEGDLDYQQDTTSLTANWFGFGDGETSVKYAISVGSAPGLQDVHPFEDVGGVNAFTIFFQLIPGVKYFATVKACNEVDICTTATSDGIVADNTRPLPGVVKVGYNEFHSQYQAEVSSITVRWFGFSDPQSFIQHYEWCVGADDADDCSEIAYTYAHLSLTVRMGKINLTPHKKLYVKVKATNNAKLVTVASSNSFTIDNTAPIVKTAPTFNTIGLSRKNDTQYDRSVIRVKWEFADSESPIVRHVVTVKSHDDQEHPVEEFHMDAATHVTFELDGGRQMSDGNHYWATVTGCNAAGLCTTATSPALLVDSTPPILGHFLHNLTYGGGGSTAYLVWEGFYDGQSGIDKYVVAFGSSYHSWDVLAPTDVSHDSSSETQSHSFTLTKSVNAGDVIYITIYAVNGAGMSSDIGQTSVDVTSPDKLFIQRHSCPVIGCLKVCSCGEYGGTYYSCRHGGPQESCNNVSAPGQLKVVDGLDLNSDQDYTPSDKCLSGSWEPQNNAFRYEWGFGRKGQGVGSALFNMLTEKFRFDNGLVTSAVYCLPYSKELVQGVVYSLYVRYWLNENEYTDVESDGVRVDHSPARISRGYGVLDTGSVAGTEDIEFTTSGTAVFARWDNTFSDTDSGIHHYEIMFGTTAEGNEIVPVTYVGKATVFSKSGLSIPAGTKYYATVRAVNGVGLAVNKSSDGVTVDDEPPLGGAVYHGRWKHNHRYMSNQEALEVSWTGFSDRHSFIKEYHWGIGDNNSTANAKHFVNVQLLNHVIHRKISLTHGSTYYILVKAVDASGQETIVSSPPFIYDETPPVGYKASGLGSEVFSKGDFSTVSEINFKSAWTVEGLATFNAGTGVTVKGTISQTIDIPSFSHYQLLINTSPPCKQIFSEVTLGNNTFILDLVDELTTCKFLVVVPLEDAKAAKFSFYENSEVTVTKISLKKVTATEPANLTDSVVIRQIGLSSLFVHWTITDFESRIRFAQIGVGTTRGGLQLAPLINVGRNSHKFFENLPLKHGLPVYVSLLVINEAGEQASVVSNAKVIDWSVPDVKNITLRYTVRGPSTIDVTADWNTHASSGVDRCFWALGLARGSIDLFPWKQTNSIQQSIATNVSVSHGSKVYPTLRCISHARLENTVDGDPLLVVIDAPDVSSATLTVNSFSTTMFKALPGYQSNTEMLDISISAVQDNAGIGEYRLQLVNRDNGSVLFDYITLGRHTHFILDKLSLDENDLVNVTCYNAPVPSTASPLTTNTSQNTTTSVPLSTPASVHVCDRHYVMKTYAVSVKAVNKGGKESAPVTTEVSFYVGPPEVSGHPPTLYQHTNTKNLHVDWNKVFNYTGTGQLKYQLSIGLDVGSVNIASRVDTFNSNYMIPTWTYTHHVNYTISVTAVTPFGTFATYTSKVFNPY